VRRDGFQDKWIVRSRSANTIVLILSVVFFGPMASQLTVLHKHGDITNHVHRVPVEELSIWHTVHAHQHAHQHATWPAKQDMPLSISQDVTMELIGAGTPDTVILMMQPPSRSMEASITQLSLGTSMVYTGCSGNLQDLASRPPELGCHPPNGIAPSLVSAILRTNHTLLV
jgi:hypothetical protein